MPVNVSASDRENKTKKSGPANSGFDSPEKPSRILGAMVDIGLGPTNGFLVICAFRSGSPRRVQTDAYHRPRILNYVPCHITSFFRFPPSGSNILNISDCPCQHKGANRLLIHFSTAAICQNAFTDPRKALPAAYRCVSSSNGAIIVQRVKPCGRATPESTGQK